jgi:hypothetical protein
MLPPFGGGELLLSPSGRHAVCVSQGAQLNATRAAALQAAFPQLTAAAFLPPHPDYLPHADMSACWVGEGVLAVHLGGGAHAAAALAALAPLLQAGVSLQQLPHDPPAGHSSGRDASGWRTDASGNYAQALCTLHAVYVPQYGGAHAAADAGAL